MFWISFLSNKFNHFKCEIFLIVRRKKLKQQLFYFLIFRQNWVCWNNLIQVISKPTIIMIKYLKGYKSRHAKKKPNPPGLTIVLQWYCSRAWKPWENFRLQWCHLWFLKMWVYGLQTSKSSQSQEKTTGIA